MATKKATRTTKKTTVKEEASKPVESKTPYSVPKFKRSYVFLVIGILAVIGLLYYFRGMFVAATVNNQPISRIAFIQKLEEQGGQQTLDSMITETLIVQEAQKNNVVVTDEELNEEVKKLEENLKQQQQDLNALLEARGMTQDDLKTQLKTQKLLEKLLADKTEVTDAEVTEYITQNQEALGEQATTDEMKDQIKEQLKQQKFGEAFEAWITQVKNNANIQYFVTF